MKIKGQSCIYKKYFLAATTYELKETASEGVTINQSMNESIETDRLTFTRRTKQRPAP